MNNWQKIWNARKDTLCNVAGNDYRKIFAELKRIDGFDLNGGVDVDSLIRQHENLSDALHASGGVCLKSVAVPELICTFSHATVTRSADWIIRRR